MLNFNRESLIKAIETIKIDDVATIEWNLELIDIDLCANRGSNNEGLVSAYQLIGSREIKYKKRLTK
jgi:hypothetical protein